MCEKTEEIARYLYRSLLPTFPRLRIYRSRTTNSIYIWHHLMRAPAQKKYWHLKAFLIRVSDHGGVRDIGNNISIFRKNIDVKNKKKAYLKADKVVEEISSIGVESVSRFILNEIKKRILDGEKLKYFTLRNIMTEVKKEAFTQ